MEIAKTYSPKETEDKWYQFWMEKGFFHSEPDEREPYCIVIPPPNVTGVLHMGHMLNNTIQDVLIRKARMQGKNACWVPGTDHASIATEAKVVKMLADKGIQKKDISREEFLKYAWEWKEKYGGIILDQLKKLGASADWDRTRFTMEPSLYNAVIDVFIDLYKKGLIYRGTKMVNWDPQGKTTLSDEEVVFREVRDKLYYVKYKIENSDEFISVATARPETIAGDVAVCVNPNDPRYANLIGKNVIVPLINRIVPVITDEYIDIEFGTGVLKVTPAHDINDYNIGIKNNLPIIDTLNEDGTISPAGELYVGLDRFAARKCWITDLEKNNLLLKTEDYTHNVGFSERTDAVVEPRISTQWFMDMKKFMQKNPEVLTDVLSDKIKFYPSNLKNTYRHWLENVKDWNISRQLWWGQRIPAWYSPAGDFEVAKTAEDAAELFQKNGKNVSANSLTQDPDVLDTWFSSWLWPISVFDGFENPDNADINYYYPTNDLVTAPEIMFFWVARMVMSGYEYKREKPFSNVYYTGIVRDKQRRKMSKSLGNSPDPLDLIDKYGADGVRVGMLLCSPAGNDILFDESLVEQGRNFSNKIWNAYRLVAGFTVKPDAECNPESIESNKLASEWFQNKFNIAVTDIYKQFDEYRLSEALMTAYKLLWDNFCSTYLEMIKPAFGDSINSSALENVKKHFDSLMNLLHPFIPFITEEIHHLLHDGKPASACIISNYPVPQKSDEINDRALLIVSEIRNLRNKKNLSPKEGFDIIINGDEKVYKPFEFIIQKLANTTSIKYNQIKPEQWVTVMVETDDVHVNLPVTIDKESESLKIQEEIKYLQGFLVSVNAKLNNEKFMANANADVVGREVQKRADAEEKLNSLQQALKNL